MQLNQEVLGKVQAIARLAGEAILDVYNREQAPTIEQKSDDSPVTEADLAAHGVIVSELQRQFPDIPVLSEESKIPAFEQRQQWQRYWLVDPLDGTKEFIKRNGEFTVNIAFIEQNQVRMGVVYVPVTGICYGGVVGLGAWKTPTKGQREAIHTRRLQTRLDATETVIVVASRSHLSPAGQAMVQGLEQHWGEVEQRPIGSSLKQCLVAEGLADFYPRLGPTSEWDTAAAQGVLEAAGGAVYNSDFEPLRYNTKESLLNPDFYVVGDTEYDWKSLLNRVAKKSD